MAKKKSGAPVDTAAWFRAEKSATRSALAPPKGNPPKRSRASSDKGYPSAKVGNYRAPVDTTGMGKDADIFFPKKEGKKKSKKKGR